MHSTAQRIREKVLALQTLGLTPCHRFNCDDSQESYRILEELLGFCEEAGGRLIHTGTYNVEQIHRESIGSGTYLIVLD